MRPVKANPTFFAFAVAFQLLTHGLTAGALQDFSQIDHPAFATTFTAPQVILDAPALTGVLPHAIARAHPSLTSLEALQATLHPTTHSIYLGPTVPQEIVLLTSFGVGLATLGAATEFVAGALAVPRWLS